MFLPDPNAEKGKPHHNPKAFLTRKKLSKSKPQIHLISPPNISQNTARTVEGVPKKSARKLNQRPDRHGTN